MTIIPVTAAMLDALAPLAADFRVGEHTFDY